MPQWCHSNCSLSGTKESINRPGKLHWPLGGSQPTLQAFQLLHTVPISYQFVAMRKSRGGCKPARGQCNPPSQVGLQASWSWQLCNHCDANATSHCPLKDSPLSQSLSRTWGTTGLVHLNQSASHFMALCSHKSWKQGKKRGGTVPAWWAFFLPHRYWESLRQHAWAAFQCSGHFLEQTSPR